MQYDAQLKTIDANGTPQIFYCEPPEEDTEPGEGYDTGHKTFTFRIKTKPEDIFFFQLTVREMDRYYQVVMMDHSHRPEYSKKGIPEAMIAMLATRNGVKLASSSSKDKAGNFRIGAADKVWRRLLARGVAYYCETEDRYYTM